MKNIFRFWMAVAIIFGAVSCAKEDISSSLAGGEVEVTFTANLPELGTRAYGEANHITILHYNVYQHGQEEKLAISGVCRENTNGKFFVHIPMIKGMKYDIVFWAEKEGNRFYNLDGKVLTINYDGAIANDENRDAFLATKTAFDPTSVTSPCIVELTRPFAQLNVATSDYETIKDNGIILNADSDNNSSDLNITTEVDTKFNLFTNEVADGSVKQTVTFDASKMPCASGEALNGYDGYTYLSMNYIFVLGEKESVDVEYNFTGNRATDNFKFPFTKVVIPSVPLKRNYRTNILGKLLTQTADFEVEIRPAFGEPNDNRVFNIIDLQAALDAAPENETTIINLGANIVGNVTDVQKPGRKVIIDGCGCKYNGSIKVHSNSNHYADAALTIKNLNFETSTASVNFIEALENGAQRYSCNITVEDCTFTATGDAANTAVGVQIKASKNAKVIGCTATNMHSLIQAQSCDESVLVQNCTVNGKNGVAFKQVRSAVVEGTTITAAEYGIRFDGNTDNYGITVKNNNVTASQPFIVRKMTGANNTIALEGDNTLTVSAASISTEAPAYQIVITNGSDDEAYVKPTGTYTLTGADDYLVYPRDVYFLVATSAELVTALQTAVAAGETNIVFDANGANIGNFNKDDNTWFTTNLVPAGVTVTLRDAKVTGISRNNSADGTLVFDNCSFSNNSAYSINFIGGNGRVVFNNCKLVGWCSFSGVTVEMNDCNIAGNGKYALVRSYNTFTMNNCTIDCTNTNTSDDYHDGVSIGGGAVMTMTDCTMNNAGYEYGEAADHKTMDYSSYILVNGKRLVCNPASLEYALKNGNAILMENNITVEAHLTKTSHGTNINIDGGGNELTLRGIYGVSGANVSLSNMTLVDSKTDDYTIFNQGGKIELNNVTYNSTINMAFQMAGGGDVVLTDCNISGDVTGDYAASNIWCGDGRNVTVNGGTYGSIFMNAQYHSGWPAASAHAASKITLNDGTITKLTLETELGAEGYYVSATLTQNGGTITNLVENPQNLDLTGRSQYNK